MRDFLDAYPYPIELQSNHVTCGDANWASWRTWPAKIADGSMRRSAEELLWINCIGNRSIGEQPPTAHQHTVGPPTYVSNGNQFGAPDKTYYKWARNLPRVLCRRASSTWPSGGPSCSCPATPRPRR